MRDEKNSYRVSHALSIGFLRTTLCITSFEGSMQDVPSMVVLPGTPHGCPKSYSCTTSLTRAENSSVPALMCWEADQHGVREASGGSVILLVEGSDLLLLLHNFLLLGGFLRFGFLLLWMMENLNGSELEMCSKALWCGLSNTDSKVPGIHVGDRDFPLLDNRHLSLNVGIPRNNPNHRIQLPLPSCAFERADAGHFMTLISSRVLLKIPTSSWMTMLNFIQTP